MITGWVVRRHQFKAEAKIYTTPLGYFHPHNIRQLCMSSALSMRMRAASFTQLKLNESHVENLMFYYTTSQLIKSTSFKNKDCLIGRQKEDLESCWNCDSSLQKFIICTCF